ncbi:MAG TPA: DUF484 family protein [Sphingomicrobium sp.]|nr:DUF484 family protein [Sphingomicrobium sp.]
MGRVIQFEPSALANLRERLGAVESANEDLIAFARGHSGAVSTIHSAVLAAIDAVNFESLVTTVTGDWPVILGIDVVSLALVVGNEAFLIGPHGVTMLEAQIVDRALELLDEVELRAVDRGHILFGSGASDIAAEALIRLDCGPDLPYGLLALGQRRAEQVRAGHGADLLRFLGQSLAAMISRCLKQPIA